MKWFCLFVALFHPLLVLTGQSQWHHAPPHHHHHEPHPHHHEPHPHHHEPHHHHHHHDDECITHENCNRAADKSLSNILYKLRRALPMPYPSMPPYRKCEIFLEDITFARMGPVCKRNHDRISILKARASDVKLKCRMQLLPTQLLFHIADITNVQREVCLANNLMRDMRAPQRLQEVQSALSGVCGVPKGIFGYVDPINKHPDFADKSHGHRHKRNIFSLPGSSKLPFDAMDAGSYQIPDEILNSAQRMVGLEGTVVFDLKDVLFSLTHEVGHTIGNVTVNKLSSENIKSTYCRGSGHFELICSCFLHQKLFRALFLDFQRSLFPCYFHGAHFAGEKENWLWHKC